MEITTDISETRWREFIARSSGANIFQSPEMYEVYRRAIGFEPLVVAVTSGPEIRSLMASVLVSNGPRPLSRFTTRCIVAGGPLGESGAFPDLLAAHDRMVAPRALVTQVRNLRAPDQRDAFESAGYVWEDHLNFVLDLRISEADLLARMSKARRKGIAAGEKVGLAVGSVDRSELDRAYRLLRETYNRSGAPLAPGSLFGAALEVLTPRDRILGRMALLDGEVCAVRFILRWDHSLYDWYAGSSDFGREVHADEWLVWEILREGVAKGCATFDFGGAGPPNEPYGPREFKRRFGGSETNPGRFEKAYRPAASKVAKAAYALWRRLR